MATSPNYGWLEPDNTDLVKNGALAIRTLGNAIDTTMATMVPKSIVDAKGDIIAASANDTPARLAVGANDLLVTAASGEATGLKYTGSWTSYTPTLTNFTLGNGSRTAKYNQIGKIVFVRINITLGSTSVMGSYPTATLPITAASSGYITGTTQMVDSGVASYISAPFLASTTTVELGLTLTNGTYAKASAITSAEPFTWGTNDLLGVDFYYEVA